MLLLHLDLALKTGQRDVVYSAHLIEVSERQLLIAIGQDIDVSPELGRSDELGVVIVVDKKEGSRFF
jgi:hypothetical protein